MRRILAVALPVGGVLLLVAHALFMRRLFLGNSFDDAYIAYRYADHLAHGLGLVFNPGERLEGYSDLLWVLLLTPVARWGGDLVLASHVLGLACSAASVALAVVAMRRVLGAAEPLAAAALVLLLAGSGYVAAWAVGGLEGPLFGLLLLGSWMALAAPRPVVAAVLLSALALTRPEGIVIALGASVVAAGRARHPAGRRMVWIPIVVLGVVVIYEAWRFAYYGVSLVPNSVRAKVGLSAWQALRGARYVAWQFLIPYAPLLLPCVLFRTWRPLAAPVRRALTVGAALVLGSLLLVVAVGGDWSEGRLFAPLLPLAATLAAGWSVHVVPRLRWSRTRARTTALAVAAFLTACYVVTGPRREAAIRRQYAATDAERIAIGRWLREHMPPDVVVAVRAAGQIPYYSRLQAHDMLGLTDAHIAALSVPGFGRGGAGHEKFDIGYTLGTVRPGVIVNPRLLPGLLRHPLYLRDYHPLEGPWALNQLAIRHDLAVRLGLLDRSQAP